VILVPNFPAFVRDKFHAGNQEKNQDRDLDDYFVRSAVHRSSLSLCETL
jgi:hypothetical protein